MGKDTNFESVGLGVPAQSCSNYSCRCIGCIVYPSGPMAVCWPEK